MSSSLDVDEESEVVSLDKAPLASSVFSGAEVTVVEEGAVALDEEEVEVLEEEGAAADAAETLEDEETGALDEEEVTLALESGVAAAVALAVATAVEFVLFALEGEALESVLF